jgi:hypothetical protein
MASLAGNGRELHVLDVGEVGVLRLAGIHQPGDDPASGNVLLDKDLFGG